MGVVTQGAEVVSEPPNGSSSNQGCSGFKPERYPWMPHSGYEPTKTPDVYKAPWGREYTGHAIDRTLPSGLSGEGRSIPPSVVELAIAHGLRTPYQPSGSNYPKGWTFSLGDIRVGTNYNETRVTTVINEHD